MEEPTIIESEVAGIERFCLPGPIRTKEDLGVLLKGIDRSVIEQMLKDGKKVYIRTKKEGVEIADETDPVDDNYDLLPGWELISNGIDIMEMRDILSTKRLTK